MPPEMMGASWKHAAKDKRPIEMSMYDRPMATAYPCPARIKSAAATQRV
jgi:hypothetical protein